MPGPVIVMVCTGNSCRSPMAAGFLEQLWRDEVPATVLSAGTSAFPGTPAAPEAIAAARELGADIGRHRAREIDQALMDEATLVIAMTRSHAEWLQSRFPESGGKVLTLGELARGDAGPDIMDPIGYSLETYRQVAAEIHTLLKESRENIKARL